MPLPKGTDVSHTTPQRHLLITAGPTHEPIDAVRYIGNRSSGRLGCALADEAARRGWQVTLLLGPTSLKASHPAVRTLRFTTVADLEALLAQHLDAADVLVMAAAVADYRPIPSQTDPHGKLRRTPGELVIRLEPTPDLLAGCATRRRADQLLVGFALEPRQTMLESARAKIERKRIDAIVANPLETMDSDRIEAILVGAPGSAIAQGVPTPGPIPKAEFAGWLLDRLESIVRVEPPARVQGGSRASR